MDNTFTVKYSGVFPDSIPLSELKDYLAIVEDLVLGLWKDEGIKSELPRISLINIEKGSTGFHFATTDPEEVIPLANAGFSKVAEGQFDSLPVRCQTAARKLAEASQRWGEAKVYNGEKYVVTIPANLECPKVKSQPVYGPTVLYGKLRSVGGRTPAAWIVCDSGKAVKCTLTEQLARQIAPKIYSRVGVEGIAEYNPEDWSITSFQIKKILDYEGTSISKALKNLFIASPEAWAHVSDVNEYLERHRAEGDEEW